MLVDIPAHSYRDYNLGVGPIWNPFVHALKHSIVDNEDLAARLAQRLRLYFAAFSPSNPFEYIGLTPTLAPGLIEGEAWTVPYPWSRNQVQDDLRIMRKGLAQENQRWLSESVLGCSWCGPVDEQKIKIETQRFYAILSSVRQRGYTRHDGPDGDIEVVRLVDHRGGDTCHLLHSGAHRAAVLLALGHKVLPVKIVGSISLDGLATWPNVVNGCYTQVGALLLFSRVLHGLPTTCLGGALVTLFSNRPTVQQMINGGSV